MSGRLRVSEAAELVRDAADTFSSPQPNPGANATPGPKETLQGRHPSEQTQIPGGFFLDGFRSALRSAEELVSFGQGNVDALVKSSQIWAAGVQDLTRQILATAQASFHETQASVKALTSVKSPQDAFDLQTKLVRTGLEKTLAESGRIGDASVTLFQQTLAPIVARATLVAQKLSATDA